MTAETFIHDSADAQSKCIGTGSRIWQYVVILPGAVVGKETNICSHCFIENDVIIGDRVTIKNGVQLWDGVRIEDDVFIGPNVTFTNDRYPRSKFRPERFLQTTIGQGASIGASATILPGLSIGQKAAIGAGAVVTRSIPPNAVAIGNPARVVSYIGVGHTDSGSTNKEKHLTDASSARPLVNGADLYELPNFRDQRGSLSVGEFPGAVPFAVARYFLVYDVPSAEIRGEHAHKQCHQFLIAVHGSVAVVADDGRNREEFLLDRRTIGLHLKPMTWGIQYKYSSDAVLLVFASHAYDADDYIRDYGEYIEALRKP